MAKTGTSVARRIALSLSGLFFFVLTVLLIDTIIDIWPSVGVQSEICQRAEAMSPEEREPFLEKMRDNHKVNCRFKDIPITRVNLGGKHTFLSPDQGLFGLVGIFAALGALIRSLRSVVWSAAGWDEKDYAVLWNLLRPVFGAAIAIGGYVVLRALFLPSGTLVDANPYGFVAFAMVIGFFSGELLCWAVGRGKALTRSAG